MSGWLQFGQDGDIVSGWLQFGRDGGIVSGWLQFGQDGDIASGWLQFGQDGDIVPGWAQFGQDGGADGNIIPLYIRMAQIPSGWQRDFRTILVLSSFFGGQHFSVVLFRTLVVGFGLCQDGNDHHPSVFLAFQDGRIPPS